MEFQIAVSAPPDRLRFVLMIEPEAMHYEFPKEGKVVLAFRGPDSMLAELIHYPDAVVIWRPADTQVWATTADGHLNRSAGSMTIRVPTGTPAESRWIDRCGNWSRTFSTTNLRRTIPLLEQTLPG
ncbi:hypothetical protein [Nocardia sp. NPDC052316]|uniref:hypothetical protein n=1 Tax=Nocardia sp. NPDC052316 TaxID=3364329 RepID=UPI0037CCB1CE